MIKECLEIFEKNLKEDPNMVLRGYIPKDGKYNLVVMKDDGNWKLISKSQIEYDKKEKKIKNEPLDYSYIKFLDYHSNLLNMNKAIDNKKAIHSSNYYSFFFKESSYEEKINKAAIERYFSILKNPLKKYKDKRAKLLYLENEDKLGLVDVDEVSRIEKWLIRNLNKKELFEIDSSSKKYFKIFFVYENQDDTKKAYKREQDRYLLTNLFNKNKYNIEIDGRILGLSDDNLGMNDKKPFLENLDRKIQQPYLIDADTAKFQNLFFDYLSGLAKKSYRTVYFNTENKEITFDRDKNFSGYQLFLYPEKNETAILNYKQHSKKISDINIKLSQYIKENLGKNPKDKDIAKRESKYGLFTEKIKLFEKIDSAFFYNFYIRNRHNIENLNIKDTDLKFIILNYGKIMEKAIIYGKEKYLLNSIDNLLVDSIKYSLINNYNTKAVTQFNYYLSLKKYFEKREEIYMRFQEEMKRKLESAGDIKLENDKEILFSIGQVLRKLLNQSNVGNKNLTFIREFIGGQKSDMIIRNLNSLVKRYAHNISTADIRFNQALSQILIYNFDNKEVDDKYIIAGFLNDSYLYGGKVK